MIKAQSCVQRPFLRRCFLWVASSWLLLNQSVQPAIAAGTLVKTGFESPLALGADLWHQYDENNSYWLSSWNVANTPHSTAIIQNNTVKSGSQALTVTKSSALNSDRRWAVPFIPNHITPQRYVIVDWDMRVAQSPIATGSGPFFGVETYDFDTVAFTLGSLGVDAKTGEVLYQSPGSGALTPISGATVGFNQWNHFRLLLDFTADKYSAFLNGTALFAAPINFVDGARSTFTDADISALAAAGDSVSQTASSTAVFDNFLVRNGLLGDYDVDGDVDNADYTRWRQTIGNAIAPIGYNADGNANGVVDSADYVIWRKTLGASVFSGASLGTSTIPEPTGLLATLAPLLALWFSALNRKRR